MAKKKNLKKIAQFYSSMSNEEIEMISDDAIDQAMLEAEQENSRRQEQEPKQYGFPKKLTLPFKFYEKRLYDSSLRVSPQEMGFFRTPQAYLEGNNRFEGRATTKRLPDA